MKNRIVYSAMAVLLALVMVGELAAATVQTIGQPINQTVTCVGREATLSLQIQDSRLISASVDGMLQYVEQSPVPVMELPDHTLVYEFIVDDSYDTNTYYNFGLLNGMIQGRHIFQNGNDTDTYDGWLVAKGNDAFVCN